MKGKLRGFGKKLLMFILIFVLNLRSTNTIVFIAITCNMYIYFFFRLSRKIQDFINLKENETKDIRFHLHSCKTLYGKCLLSKVLYL